ncbi:Mak10 subunit, NatC N-terminal acetyltransferase-domain-containing protein [Phlyctochytrium arcticum]|nr:Mak10 subunit, NatC N-terminal acetyltransferase-domain-containing protein [Phlyctochytrium arcticum]
MALKTIEEDATGQPGFATQQTGFEMEFDEKVNPGVDFQWQQLGPPVAPDWVDVTDFFKQATDEIEVGRLVHEDQFTLWDAMSAIEMMDPKMDAGITLSPELTAGKLTVADIPSKQFTAGEVIGIMDELLSFEFLWLSGRPLCQTLFTCVYLHDPYAVDCPIVRDLIIMVMKTADLIRLEVSRARVFEEEDFLPDTMGLRLCEEVQQSEALSGLIRADNEIRVFKNQLLARGRLAEKSPLLKVDFPTEPVIDFVDALLARCQFRGSFYSAIEALGRRDVTLAHQHLLDAKLQLEIIATTISLGADVTSSFNPHITRKLFTQAPPKPVEAMERDKAVAEVIIMVQHLLEVCQISTFNHPTTLIRAMDNLSARTPRPNVLTLSLLHIVIFQEGKLCGHTPISDAIRSAVYGFTESEHWLAVQSQRSEILDILVNHALDPFVMLMSLYQFNRARQHRRLRKGFVSWEALQIEAEALDMDLHANIRDLAVTNGDKPELPFLLSSWVYHNKLNMMTLFLLLGYELDLYGSYEHAAIFWYLEYLFEMQGNHLERVERTRHRSTSSAGPPASPATSTGSLQLLLLMKEVSGKESLFRGLFRSSKWLHQLGLVRPPSHAAYNSKIHYEHRFRSFRHLNIPAPLPYENYEAAMAESEPIELAQEDFASARKSFERVLQHLKSDIMGIESQNALEPQLLCLRDQQQNLEGLIKVCIGNGLAIRSLATFSTAKLSSRGDEVSSDTAKLSLPKISFTGKYHQQVPTIIVDLAS